MTPLVREMSALVQDPQKPTWFDLGVLDGDYTIEVDPEFLIKLPFEHIAIVGQTERQKFAVRAICKDSGVAVSGFALSDQMILFEPFAYLLGPDGLQLYRDDNVSTQFTKRFKNAFGGASEISMETRRCIGVIDVLLRRLDRKAYKLEAKDTFTNRRKKSQGKPLSYDWRTISVPDQIRSSTPGTGTHASPRAHDRRGHWRIVKNKKVWVKPCRVGDASKGSVFHDYKVTASFPSGPLPPAAPSPTATA